MAFLDVSFPQSVAASVSRGLVRKVNILTLANGEERRSARWRNSLRVYNAGSGIRDLDDLDAVVQLFEEVEGTLHSFRFRDWADFQSGATRQPPTPFDQTIGVGDGSTKTFQLTKSYGRTAPYTRAITKPLAESVRIAVDGIERGDWSLDATSGEVTFVGTPSEGMAVTAGFLFDVPVRFASDQLDVDLSFFSEAEHRGLARAPEIQLKEVRE